MNRKHSSRTATAKDATAASAQRFKELIAKKSFSGFMRLSSRLNLDVVLKALAAYALKVECEATLYVKMPGMDMTQGAHQTVHQVTTRGPA